MNTLTIISGVVLVAVLIALHELEKRHRLRRKISDEEILFLLSRRLETSEFRLFCLAAEAWKVSRQKVESDFKAYLLQDRIPYYVRDFVRKAARKMAENGRLITGMNDTMLGPGSTFHSP